MKEVSQLHAIAGAYGEAGERLLAAAADRWPGLDQKYSLLNEYRAADDDPPGHTISEQVGRPAQARAHGLLLCTGGHLRVLRGRRRR